MLFKSIFGPKDQLAVELLIAGVVIDLRLSLNAEVFCAPVVINSATKDPLYAAGFRVGYIFVQRCIGCLYVAV
jgi:hypothetical protein